jgi:hypothetical protein
VPAETVRSQLARDELSIELNEPLAVLRVFVSSLFWKASVYVVNPPYSPSGLNDS